MTKSNFWQISPLLQCKTGNGCKNRVCGFIMLKIVLVAHLTYENQWGKWHTKIQTFVFFGTPYCTTKTTCLCNNCDLTVESQPSSCISGDEWTLQQESSWYSLVCFVPISLINFLELQLGGKAPFFRDPFLPLFSLPPPPCQERRTGFIGLCKVIRTNEHKDPPNVRWKGFKL